MENWSITQAEETYNISNWGINFFKVNDVGNVEVFPHKNGKGIDLKKLADDVQRQNIHLPVLVRFSDILESRIKKLYSCFINAAKEFGYIGKYFGVYPIKVNQQRQVVEELVRFGKAYNLGLEAGSKPELHAVLAMMDSPDSPIICNGYKDYAYISMALMGQKLNRTIIIVVEKLTELDLIIQASKNLNIRPKIGLRIKLASVGSGRWEKSAGEFSKFGLTAAEIMLAIQKANHENMLDTIELLHFHLGSQITNIRHLKNGLKEVCRYFVELQKAGCSIQYIDVGGGLGVDYDGSRSTVQSSVNYSMQEYANDIVYHILEACSQENLTHPHIISESGRALTAHHSVIIFDVLAVSSQPVWNGGLSIEEDDNEAIKELHNILSELNELNMIEAWHDAVELKEQVQNKFNLGLISLQERAKAERLFWTIARIIHQDSQNNEILPNELHPLREQLADQYFCNFSIFQSVPDSWAIEQIFPITPIHRLNEKPTKEATLYDITCDSDGKINQFIGRLQNSPVLPVHELKPEEPYLLAIFLVGAYQEILGDLHNLFGDTNTVHVALNEDGTWHYEQVIRGENITDVLNYVQFDADNLLERMSNLIRNGLENKTISTNEAEELMKLYQQGLQGYTYLIRQSIE